MKNDEYVCKAIEAALMMADKPLEKMAAGEPLPINDINAFLEDLKKKKECFQELSPEIRKICCSLIETVSLMYNYSNIKTLCH